MRHVDWVVHEELEFGNCVETEPVGTPAARVYYSDTACYIWYKNQ